MDSKASKLLVAFCLFVVSSGCNASGAKHKKIQQLKPFTESTHFPTEQKKLRQWDSPVVADLDKDGWPDLLLNDHGFSVRVMWNNNGKYSKPYDLIMGDMHGISVGDINSDGQNEIVISRGGGSGSNARNTKIFTVDKNRTITAMPDYRPPLALMRGRTVKLVDLDNDGDLDLMNFAFAAKGLQGESENYLYRNDNGQLLLAGKLPKTFADGQKTLLTDFNSDGQIDFFWYGNGEVKVYENKGKFTFEDVTKLWLPDDYHDASSIAEIDFDNDGDFDIFITRGKEFLKGETFLNKEKQLLGYYTKRGVFNFENIKAGDVLKLENIQSQWPQKGLFLGESGYEFLYPGETHSGRSVRLVNSDALGFPESMTNKGTYVGYVGNENWRIAGNIWSPSSMVIHGVSDYPESEHSQGLSNTLLENTGGKFVDVSAKQGFIALDHSVSVGVADLTNNGFSDLIVVRRGELVYSNHAVVYLNENGQFKQVLGHGIVTHELGALGMGVQPLDYNQDGKVDVLLGNERGKWHLFDNNSLLGQTRNNYLSIDVASLSSKNALGAFVQIESCGQKQAKRVGATGAAYSLSFDQHLHFGLAQCNQPITISITWSDLSQDKFKTSSLNKIFQNKDTK